MSKSYEDLSRRGLIKLSHDFDQENNGALLQYLAEHGDEYENIRPVEKVVERTDQIIQTVSTTTKGIREALADRDTKDITMAVLDCVIDNADVIKKGINAVGAVIC